jgi:nucleoside 2-deoxyribosyltransferase
MTTRIFVSYSYADQDRVLPILENLSRFAPEIPVDREIMDPLQVGVSSGSIREAIQEQMRAADLVVVLLTPNNQASPWAMYEVGMATALGKPIVALATQDVESSSPLLSALYASARVHRIASSA